MVDVQHSSINVLAASVKKVEFVDTSTLSKKGNCTNSISGKRTHAFLS